MDAIENSRPPEIDVEIGLRAKAICEAIYESNACGQVVNYDDVVAGKIERYQKPINAHWGLLRAFVDSKLCIRHCTPPS